MTAAAKKRYPSAKGSVADDGRSAKCVYCDETKPLAAFNREHVLPEAFGKYEGNLVLRERVCWDCNDYFGRTLDLSLARDSKEGLDRFAHGLAQPKPGRKVGTSVILKQRGGRFDGALLDWELDTAGTELRAKPARQVGFAGTEEGPFEWHRVEHLPPLGALRSRGFTYCVIGGLDAAEAAEFIAALGFEEIVLVALADPRDPDGMLDTTMEGSIDQPVRRAIAKVAFNYLAYCYSAIASMEQFREIRRYIRFGELPGENPVTVSTKSILGGRPAGEQIVAHILTVRWTGRQVIAQVSLFGWLQYQVVLSTAAFVILPTCIDSGHMYNPYGKQIAQLTRDRRLARRNVPLMTKEEFRVRAQEGAGGPVVAGRMRKRNRRG